MIYSNEHLQIDTTVMRLASGKWCVRIRELENDAQVFVGGFPTQAAAEAYARSVVTWS
jgi:hypothetical protein